MLVLGPLGFTAPWLLLGLAALPVLWWLLRAVPPAPVIRRFPGVALLLGLRDDETQTDRTPWWLMLLRMLAVAAVILGFAGPVLNPRTEVPGSGPLLVVLDASWAAASDWPRAETRLAALLADASREGRPVAVVPLTDLPAGELPFQAADAWAERLPALAPRPWEPDADAVAEWAATLPAAGAFETWWFSDGIAREGREALLETLEAQGRVTVFQSGRPVLALRPPAFEDGIITLSAVRSEAGPAVEVTATGHGPDPSGIERELARARLTFDEGATLAEVTLSLQPELRNRITRFQIGSERSAGAVSLADDTLQRRKVALIGAGDGRESLELLSPLYYLRQALDPVADLIEGSFDDVLLATPDVIVLADVARVTEQETAELTGWMERGGLLVRFAGPRLAASDVSRSDLDPLMPVRLRAGGRTVGGAMSWGEPRHLSPFDADSPFHGLPVPGDVTVSAQVLAQPDPYLAEASIAALEDGTPLVTRKRVGQGQVVLFHVTANAEWSSLPMSGLFVQMLERLAVSTRPSRPSAEDLAGSSWRPFRLIDAFGVVSEAPDSARPVAGERLAEDPPSRELPPGVYADGERRLALNVAAADTVLAPAEWPARVDIQGMAEVREQPLKGVFLGAAMLALMADILASLWLSGRLAGGGAARRGGAAGAAMLALALMLPQGADAQSGDLAPNDALALAATEAVVLAYVVTGDPRVDEISEAGMRGLSLTLYRRSSVEPEPAIGIDIENDELAFFPFIYWPITEAAPIPSDDAYARINRYLRSGGMIVFDTRDADMAEFGFSSPAGRRLQEIARLLDIPPLEPVPNDHVLTRTFYLLQDFPGRHNGQVWVEAAPADAQLVEGMPFRNLNDGVTPVVIGGNDWAAAWAVDERGLPLLTIGRGGAGERQREIAYRFGVNLVMHVLTGNYKSDQVHVPALLERLGQ